MSEEKLAGVDEKTANDGCLMPLTLEIAKDDALFAKWKDTYISEECRYYQLPKSRFGEVFEAFPEAMRDVVLGIPYVTENKVKSGNGAALVVTEDDFDPSTRQRIADSASNFLKMIEKLTAKMKDTNNE